MPQIPSNFEELPLVKNLPTGTRLTITSAVLGKTEKNGYPSVTLETEEEGKLFSIDAGVIYQINQVGADKISAKDPLKVVTTTYKNKFNSVSVSIKNV